MSQERDLDIIYPKLLPFEWLKHPTHSGDLLDKFVGKLLLFHFFETTCLKIEEPAPRLESDGPVNMTPNLLVGSTSLKKCE